MKLSKLVIFVFLLCLYGQVFSQTETSTEAKMNIRPFGIGLHLEQFKMHELAMGVDNIASNKIVLTFNPSHSFRVEPEFGYNRDKHTSGARDTKTSNMNMGLGVFGMTQHNRLNIYGGARFEYNIQTQKQIYSSGNSTTTVNIFTLGPALGCEYYLSDQVALGGEFAVKFATLSNGYKVNGQENGNSDEDDKKYLWTDTGLFLRFYF
ncbi:MAG: outer membrane beta-barrel protein [Candidatus Saccharibacteria bacterium]